MTPASTDCVFDKRGWNNDRLHGALINSLATSSFSTLFFNGFLRTRSFEINVYHFLTKNVLWFIWCDLTNIKKQQQH